MGKDKYLIYKILFTKVIHSKIKLSSIKAKYITINSYFTTLAKHKLNRLSENENILKTKLFSFIISSLIK